MAEQTVPFILKNFGDKLAQLGLNLGAGGGDASGNASNYLPDITNPAPIYGLQPPPTNTTSVVPQITDLQTRPPIDPTTPPPPIADRYAGMNAAANQAAIDNTPSIGTGGLALPEAPALPQIPPANPYYQNQMTGGPAPQHVGFQGAAPGIDPNAPVIAGNDTTTQPDTNGLPNIPGYTARQPSAMEQELTKVMAKADQYHTGLWRSKSDATKTTSNPSVVKGHEDEWDQEVAPGTERKKKWSTWDKIGNALLGWAQGGIVGGVQGATDRNWWRKQQDQQQIAQLLPRIQAMQQIEGRNAQTQKALDAPVMARIRQKNLFDRATQAQQARMDLHKFDADVRAGDTKLWFDDNGLGWKVHLKTGAKGEKLPNDPLMDPTTGQQERSTKFQMFPYEDPMTGQTFMLPGSKIAGYGVAEQLGNLTSQRLSDEANASRQMEAQRTNISNWNTYTTQLLTQAQNIITQTGKADASFAELTKWKTDVDNKAQLYESVWNEEMAKGTAANKDKINEAAVALGNAQANLAEAASKTESGAKAIEALKNLGVQQPQQMKAVILKPVQIPTGGGGKMTATRAEIEQYAKEKGKSPGTVEAQLKNQGYTIIP